MLWSQCLITPDISFQLVGAGFDQRQATEAYLVSDKNEQLALNYMLDQQ